MQTPKPYRISWEEYALKLAETAALRSEDPYEQVGACALDENNRVIALGYNGLAQGKHPPEDFWDDRDGRRPYVLHAEANCLSLCKKREAKVLAVTLLPCSACATMIAAHDIPRVVYHKEYNKDQKALDIFSFYDIELVKI